ncbi:actin-like ATPase domain-containing protein [Penicillium frequentans]|uniref:Actin-like ATPase domain-containing protein n=1 Tax=Penicillium frequentans TaxID=3151616 RepID=A0AAD6GD86_9EURO|nr:actin-like ATPase domain-containing protein [Penicillium glabrum]
MSNQKVDYQPPITERNRSQIIIGIDFGATFTAAAYAVASDGMRKVKVLSQWPKSFARPIKGFPKQPKIETVGYYNQYLNMVGWSESEDEVISYAGYPRPGIQKIEEFRYHIAPLKDANLESPPLPPGKTIEGVMVDFLSHVRQSILSQLPDASDLSLDASHISHRYFITIPASWDEDARSKLRSMAIEAGFRVRSETDFALVTGTEAALFQADFDDSSSFQVGDNILVADCGGHLVEMVTYEVKSKNPLRLAKCTGLSVEAAGASAISSCFHNIVREKIKKMKLVNRPPRVYAKCRDFFRSEVIPQFGNPDYPPPAFLDLKRAGDFWCDVGIELEFPEADIEEGCMWFTKEEMLSCFDPSVNQILGMIEEQFCAIKLQQKTLKSCLLVGGSLVNPYISSRVNSCLSLHEIKVIQSDTNLTCVKGTVLAGMRDVYD